MSNFTTDLARLVSLLGCILLLAGGAGACVTAPPTLNATEAQQTLDTAIQMAVNQQVTAAAQTLEKTSITATIDAAVRATLQAQRFPTPTSEVATGPIFSELLQTASPDIFRSLELKNNVTNAFVRLEKADNGSWYVLSSSQDQAKRADQAAARNALITISTLVFQNRFEDNSLSIFGLDHPQFTFTIFDQSDQEYTLLIGSKSPTSARYYARFPDSNTIYLVPGSSIDQLVHLITEPPYSGV